MNKTLSPLEREAIMLTLRQQFIQEELTQGELPKLLRKKVLGFSQQRYALLAGISRRTLSDIEQDKGNTTLTTLNRAFKPLGLRTGYYRVSQPHLLQTLIQQRTAPGEHHDNP